MPLLLVLPALPLGQHPGLVTLELAKVTGLSGSVCRAVRRMVRRVLLELLDALPVDVAHLWLINRTHP